jgi:hypothetical protein
MAHQWLTLTDLDHVGAAAEADLVLRLDHHFDARQVVWQMAKIALGWGTPGGAVSASATAVSRSSKASWRASGFSCSDFFP